MQFHPLPRHFDHPINGLPPLPSATLGRATLVENQHGVGCCIVGSEQRKIENSSPPCFLHWFCTATLSRPGCDIDDRRLHFVPDSHIRPRHWQICQSSTCWAVSVALGDVPTRLAVPKVVRCSVQIHPQPCYFGSRTAHSPRPWFHGQGCQTSPLSSPVGG